MRIEGDDEEDKGTAAEEVADTTSGDDSFDKAFDEFAAAKDAAANPEAAAAAQAREANSDEADRRAAAEHDPTGGQAREAAAEAAAAEAAGADGKKPGKKAAKKDADLDAMTPEELRAYTKRLRGDLSGKAQSIEALKRDLQVHQTTVTELMRKVPAAGGDTVPAKGADARDDQNGKKKPLLDPEQLKEVKELYPEIAKPLEAMAEAIESRHTTTENTLSQIEQERARNFVAGQAAKLQEAHPDFPEIRQTAEFKAWATDAPKYIRDALLRNSRAIVDADEASDVIKRYKLEMGIETPSASAAEDTENRERKPSGQAEEAKPGTPPQSQATRRRIQLESGATAPGKGTGPADGPANDFDQGFDYYARKAEEKMRKEGRL